MIACMHYTYMWESIAWPHHFIAMEVWAHKTILTMPPVIEVPVPSHESEWLCISAKVNELVSFYHFSIGCWKCSDSVVFFVFNFTLYQVTFSLLVFCKRFHWCNCSSRACFTSEKCNVPDGIWSWNSRIGGKKPQTCCSLVRYS